MELASIAGCMAGVSIGIGIYERDWKLVVQALVLEAVIIYGIASGQI